jgi:hypothetical protein
MPAQPDEHRCSLAPILVIRNCAAAEQYVPPSAGMSRGEIDMKRAVFRWPRRKARHPFVDITVTCPDCGVVRIPPERVTLQHSLDMARWCYRFQCPKCRVQTIGTSAPHVSIAAIAAGARYEPQTPLTEVAERPGGPAFTEADVVELHNLLQQPHWIDALSQYRPLY